MATATATWVKLEGMKGVEIYRGAVKTTIRFTKMVNGERMKETVDIDPLALLDGRGRPKAALVSMYNEWCCKMAAKVREVAESGLRVPTLRELAAFYEVTARKRGHNPNFRKPTDRTIDEALKGLAYCVKEAGLGWDVPYTKLMNLQTEKKIFDSFCTRMKGTSAWTFLNKLQSVIPDWSLSYYREAGWKVEQTPLPDVGLARKAPRYVRPSKELLDRMDEFYLSMMDWKDGRCFMLMTFVYQLAMRPVDVGRLTKKNFVWTKDADGNDEVRLVYTPVKTENSSGATICYPIAKCTWSYIQGFYDFDKMGDDELLVPHWHNVENVINAAGREYCHMEHTNKFLYEYRKACIDWTYHHVSSKAAMEISGDRQSTIEQYYADPFNNPEAKPIAVGAIGALGLKAAA